MKEKQAINLLQRGHAQALGSLKTTGAALLASSLMLIIVLSIMMRKELINESMVQARVTAATSQAVLMFGDEKAGGEILASLAASPTIDRAALFTAKGEVLAEYRGAGDAASKMLDARLKTTGYEFTLTRLDVAEEIRQGDERIGLLVLRYSLTPFYRKLAGHAAVILGVALGALLLVQLFLARMKSTVNRAERFLDYLAFYDPVTSLLNRRGFNMRLAEAIEQAREEGGEIGLILMDLDNFKVVNDTMGHVFGDEILRMVGQRLLSLSRSTDTACRIGGDEFVVIMRQRDDSPHDMAGIANRVIALLADPFKHQEHEFFLTASVGCSVYPRDAEDAETLMRKADTAMYYAKLEGKNTYSLFRPEMDAAAQKRLTLEKSLRRALEGAEFEMHYQPQIELKSGRIVGVESLLRWTHPEMGPISPADFIPVAEESGLIVDIGKWILRHACQQMAQWRAAGLEPMRMAVNLSARQFKDQGLMSTVNAALTQSGLSPLLLEIEITEGILMENVQSNVRLLQHFRQAGISISIDDFGTGYSSLSYLKRFPLNHVKVDRSFVHDIPGEGEAFVTAIIAMAHSLGLTVIAEGVETEAQRRFLLAAGCDIAQGYYFARPTPAAEVEAVLREGRIIRPMIDQAAPMLRDGRIVRPPTGT